MNPDATLVYDADCGFCTRSAQWLAATGKVRIVAWQSLDLAQHGLSVEDVTAAAQWLGPEGPRASGARAISLAMRARGGAAAIAGAFIALPGISLLAAAGYRVVARYRHRMPGGTAACRVTPSEAAAGDAEAAEPAARA